LGKLPFEFSAQHITAIQQQAVPQFEAAQHEAANKTVEDIPAVGLSD
jgi:hypothetical protein